jgi:PHD/YefM family antitoxin component YafN of YafNO toxin-antitoxin module
MRTANLAEEPLDLVAVLKLADQEPVLLLTPDGKEFVLTEADDFEREVEGLRIT